MLNVLQQLFATAKSRDKNNILWWSQQLLKITASINGERMWICISMVTVRVRIRVWVRVCFHLSILVLSFLAVMYSLPLCHQCQERESCSSVVWCADVVGDTAVDTLAERLDEVVVEEDWTFWRQHAVMWTFCSCVLQWLAQSHGLQQLNSLFRRITDRSQLLFAVTTCNQLLYPRQFTVQNSTLWS